MRHLLPLASSETTVHFCRRPDEAPAAFSQLRDHHAPLQSSVCTTNEQQHNWDETARCVW